jgi:hypothetical protein
MSLISVPVGPHGSLLVARRFGISESNMIIQFAAALPFRTLTCTDEYPLVTFFTLLMTLDISAVF